MLRWVSACIPVQLLHDMSLHIARITPTGSEVVPAAAYRRDDPAYDLTNDRKNQGRGACTRFILLAPPACSTTMG